jgi:Core-2/I-Branching enzyme
MPEGKLSDSRNKLKRSHKVLTVNTQVDASMARTPLYGRRSRICRLLQCLILMTIVFWLVVRSNVEFKVKEQVPPSMSTTPNRLTNHDALKTTTPNSSLYLPIGNSSSLISVSGFNYCIHLKNATFKFSNQISEANVKRLIHAVETAAATIFFDAKANNWDYHDSSLLRYACYTSCDVAENSDLPRGVGLHSLDHKSYFPRLSYEESVHVRKVRLEITANATCILKRKYRLAYVIMAHNHGLEEIKNMYRILYEEDVFFYIHLDSKEPWFKKTVKEWMKNDDLVKSRCNAAIMPNPVGVIWGHVSMVFAEIGSQL